MSPEPITGLTASEPTLRSEEHVVAKSAQAGPSQVQAQAQAQAQPEVSSWNVLRRSSTRRSRAPSVSTVPPPNPDVVAMFDPASVGGGGPLTRITTLQREREREEAEAQLRTEDGSGSMPVEAGMFSRLRTASNASRKARPKFVIPLKAADENLQEADDESTRRSRSSSRTVLDRSSSSKTLAECLGAEFDLDEKKGAIDPAGPADPVAALESQGQQPEYYYPDGGYGWVVLLGCVTLAGCTLGWGMSFNVFQDYYVHRAFPGESPSYISLISGCNIFMMNMVSFVAGRLGDRLGFKRVLFASCFLSWAGLFSASFCTTVWQLMLTQGVLAGIGQGMALPLFMSLPAQWFYRRRGLASGIAMGGAGLGGGVSVLICRQLTISYGYKRTLLIMSFVNTAAATISTIIIKTRPSAPEAQGTGRGPWVDKSVMRTSKFWSLVISLVVSTAAYGFPYSYLTSWMTLELPDVNAVLAAVPPTLLGFSVCIGRALVGLVADQLGPINTYILCFFLSGCVQWALWLTAKSFASACVFAVAYGLIAPGYLGLIPQIVVQLFGPSNLATNVGLILLFNGPGNLVSGPLGGALFSSTGGTSFQLMIWVGGALQVGAAVIACWARIKLSSRVIMKI